VFWKSLTIIPGSNYIKEREEELRETGIVCGESEGYTYLNRERPVLIKK
jgi:hypothetical protein